MSEQDLKERIGEMAYYVTQQNGTEPPFTGEYDRFFEKGKIQAESARWPLR